MTSGPSTPAGPRRRPIAGERRRARLGSVLLEPAGSATETAERAEPAVDAVLAAPAEEPVVEEVGAGSPEVAGWDDPPAVTTESAAVSPPTVSVAGDGAGDRAGVDWADRPVWLRRAVIGVAVLTVLALVAVGIVGFRAVNGYRVEQARDDAVAAATEAAAVVLAYDHRSLDEDFAAGREYLTGAFAKKYEQTTSSVVRPTAEQTNAVVKAKVMEASVVSAAPDRVIVLLYVNQTTTSDRSDDPRTDRNRVRMTMELTGGKWLISEVDAL